jgi:hypothetical protein
LIRDQRERRNEPGWSFCQYFLLQVISHHIHTVLTPKCRNQFLIVMKNQSQYLIIYIILFLEMLNALYTPCKFICPHSIFFYPLLAPLIARTLCSHLYE